MPLDILLFATGFVIVVSILLIIAPSFVERLSLWGNKIVFTDADFFTAPRVTGILLVLIGVILIYIASTQAELLNRFPEYWGMV